MTKTYKDFNSREEFVQSLGNWHYDKTSKNTEFTKIAQVGLDYSKELADIKMQLDSIKQSWNNQSIETIRSEVGKTKEADFNLDVLRGQENDKLLAGYSKQKSMYYVKRVDNESVWEKIGEQFGLKNPLVRLHVQFPGDVTVWHADIFAPYHDLLPESAAPSEYTVGQDTNIRRLLIALEDWDWGHCFMFGAQTWSQWKAGDVIYWDFCTPHCAANMGFTPRISISVTGIRTDAFEQLINNDQSEDKRYIPS